MASKGRSTMRCSAHHYYFGTPTGALQRHLIPVHIVLLRRVRDGVAPKVVRRGPTAMGCVVWRNGFQRELHRSLCLRTIQDVRAYRLRMQPKRDGARQS